jgi:hypothetical protein
MNKRILVLAMILTALARFAPAQQAEVTLQLNEQFFETLLDAIFKNNTPPEFPLAAKSGETKTESVDSKRGGAAPLANSFAETRNPKPETRSCTESLKLQREIDGVKTAVRFREGRVVVPIAFTGNYNPPLIGCLEFSGVAETNIELEFDAAKQALVGRTRVLNVNLSGAGGIGSGLLARMVQTSIDKKINPIQIIQMDKVSFVVPIQNAGSLRMKALGIRHEIANGNLNVRIAYEFQKVD